MVSIALLGLVGGVWIYNTMFRNMPQATPTNSEPLSFGKRPAVPQIVVDGRIQTEDRGLDVGTGRGFPAIEIAKAVLGCRVVGIDVWDEPARGQWRKGFVIGNSRENAERNAILEGVQDRVEFRQCDARKMTFESELFDVVVSYMALHQMVHFGGNGHRVLEEIHRVLKPSGRLVVADLMIEQRMMKKLRELGFVVEVHKVRNVRVLPPLMKILCATKGR